MASIVNHLLVLVFISSLAGSALARPPTPGPKPAKSNIQHTSDWKEVIIEPITGPPPTPPKPAIPTFRPRWPLNAVSVSWELERVRILERLEQELSLEPKQQPRQKSRKPSN
ncbi:U1 [Hyposoter didymator ichnovirus]|nr:U1 [Hyposoter didymator ichnovirus]